MFKIAVFEIKLSHWHEIELQSLRIYLREAHSIPEIDRTKEQRKDT